MTAIFQPALEYILQYEDPRHTWAVAKDSNGAPVVAGINAASFPATVTAILKVAQVNRGPAIEEFYRANLWQPMLLGALDSQDLANRVMDMETNAGEPQAAPELQRAINSLSPQFSPTAVIVDGVVGPLTIAAANECDPTALINAFRAQRVAFYTEIAAKHPADEPYLKQWLARAQA
jgi:lysozyme family protein